jgi:D-xylose transport system substrate-binding protein
MKRVAVAILLCVTACASKHESGKPKVAFLLSTLQEERYQKDKAFFTARAEALGLDVIVLAADNDNARQLAQVEDALTRGAKVLVVQPTDSQAAAAYVKLAHDSDATIIAYDRGIADPALDFAVAHDSYQVGVLQAKAAIAATGGKGKYVILAGQEGHSVAVEITRGYHDTLAPYIARGDITIVSEQWHSAWSPEQALRTVEDAIVKSGGHLDAVLANNSGMARGAVQAVEKAGLSGVFIAGADADAANVNFVCEGKQSVEVRKDIKPLAEAAAEAAAKLATAGKPDGKSTAVHVALVTPDTVKAVIVDSGFLPASALPSCAKKLAAGDK